MPRFSIWELRAFSESLATLYSASDVESLPGRVTRCLDQLFDCEVSSFDLLDMSQAKPWSLIATWPVMPRIEQLMAILQEFAHEHPLIVHARRFSYAHAIRTSDVVGLRRYRDLGVFHDFYRVHVMGVDRQLAFVDASQPTLTFGVSLNRRGRDFTDAQRGQLDLLRPHLRQAYLVAQTHQQLHAYTAPRSGACQVAGDGTLAQASETAERLLTRYFDGWKPWNKQLPSALATLFREAVTKPAKKKPIFTVRPRTWQFPEEFGTLTVQLSARLASGHWDLLLTEQPPDLPPGALAARYGLTRRQAETLYWLGQAKTNAEIGIILGLSAETIKDHVAQVLAKLAVPNRTAAARAALAG